MAKSNAATKEKAVEVKSELSMTSAQQKVVEGLPTVSARIRYLDAQKYTRSQITKLITNATGGQLRYQHVRNVLTAQAPKSTD
jgi:hypothetical protein